MATPTGAAESTRWKGSWILLAVALALPAIATAGDVRFDRITPTDGLSQYSANAVVQDSQG